MDSNGSDVEMATYSTGNSSRTIPRITRLENYAKILSSAMKGLASYKTEKLPAVEKKFNQSAQQPNYPLQQRIE